MQSTKIPINKLSIKHLISALTLIMLCALFMSPLASAEAPYPTYAEAIVDGDPSEWNLSEDFFANMYRAAKEELGNNPSPIESKLYVRYDIDSATVYLLVITEPGVTAILSAADAWAAIDGVGNKVLTGSSGNDGVPPDFAWVYEGGVLVGYEASFVLAPGTYDLKVHINVQDGDSQTSGTLSTLQLTVVPEPGTIIAFASIAGAAGLFTVYKRRQRTI